MNQSINHPAHYAANSLTIEPIDATAFLPHPLASAVEYILRAGKKEGVPEEVDLGKAVFWLKYFLENGDLQLDTYFDEDKIPLKSIIAIAYYEKLLNNNGICIFVFSIYYRNLYTNKSYIEDSIRVIEKRISDIERAE